ncbi:MAG: esterase [Pedobacter sp.]|nr:MAG: esterase [Pedobacter sp.]
MNPRFLCLVFLLLFGLQLSAQDLLVINSVHLKVQDSVMVFKPDNFNSKDKLPAVYLLHGHSANYRAWAKLADLQKLSNQYGFVIVCPDGLKRSWYLNSLNPDSLQYESFFVKELMPRINKDYRIDQENVFVTGASMGGFGAMNLFFNYPHLFSSAGSTSGVLNLRHSGFKKTTIAYILGDYSEQNKKFDDYSLINRLHQIKETGKPIIFDCGTEDYLYKANIQFRAKCDSLKIKATYIARPGAHTGSYWAKSILEHFKFFADQIKTSFKS